MARNVRWLCAALLAAAVASCKVESGPVVPPDAAPVPDSFMNPDATPEPDAAPPDAPVMPAAR